MIARHLSAAHCMLHHLLCTNAGTMYLRVEFDGLLFQALLLHGLRNFLEQTQAGQLVGLMPSLRNQSSALLP